MHANSYLEELRYIQRAVPSWSGRASLLAATMAFHLNNGLRRQGAGYDALNVDVVIDGEPCALHVRPNRGDLFIFYEVLAREAYAIPATVLDPDKVSVIVDCGANIGITALYFARKYKKARIICIEPDPDNFAILQRNVGSHERILPCWAAVVGKSGPVHLTRDRPAYGNQVRAAPAEGATVQVPGVTIRDLCAQYNLSKIDLLKIDIEGAEKDVFSDPTFLTIVGVVAIELHAPYGFEEFRRDIAPFGFRALPPKPEACRHAHLAIR